MYLLVNNISLPFTEPREAALKRAEAYLKKAGVPYTALSVARRSTDARKKRDIRFVYSVRAELNSETPKTGVCATATEDAEINPVIGEKKLSSPPLVCGFGPAGMFAALILAENGYRPTVIERGDDTEARRQAVASFNATGVLNTDSNIQFGAGGAGMFSDGKLVTRINDSLCGYVFRRLHEFGADSEILYLAKPHIGTDKLIDIIAAVRDRILSLGGNIYFNTRLQSVKYTGGNATSVVTQNGEIPCGALGLCTGHSARDIFPMLIDSGYAVQPKPFSVGVRIEHKREDIDRAMFGDAAGNPLLGAAEYAFSYRRGETGVYTFCMCPGGEVVAAASEEGGVVVNGMSRHARNGDNSNSAVAVSVVPEGNPVEYQRKLERAAFNAAASAGAFAAPIQTMGDFLSGQKGSAPTTVIPSYSRGLYDLCDLNEILPSPVTGMLKCGFHEFDKKLHGFASPSAVLTGCETRTSSPYRVMRSEDGTAIGYENVYPAGEGAGYAGGISSAAVDGVRMALNIMEKYKA